MAIDTFLAPLARLVWDHMPVSGTSLRSYIAVRTLISSHTRYLLETHLQLIQLVGGQGIVMRILTIRAFAATHDIPKRAQMEILWWGFSTLIDMAEIRGMTVGFVSDAHDLRSIDA